MDKILVTGATGHYGRAVLKSLLNKGLESKNIYAMVRDQAKAAELESLGITIVVGDYDDYDSLIKAFSGIDKLLFVSGSEMKNRITQHKQVVKAAKNAGVKHIFILASSIKATIEILQFTLS